MAFEFEKLNKEHLIQGIAIIPQKDAEKYSNTMRRENNILNEIYPVENSKIRFFSGGENNLPDRYSLNATIKVNEMCKKLTKDDILIALISGGGSALLTLPYHVKENESKEYNDNNFESKLRVIKLIVSSGATINEVNTVRGCLSSIKSGKLARLAHPAQVISLIISDVIDDPLDIIASGPTYLTDENIQRKNALEIIKKYKLEKQVMPEIIEFLKVPAEPLNNSDTQVFNYLIGNNRLATNSMSNSIQEKDYDFKCILTNSIQGEAKIIGSLFAFLSYAIIFFKRQMISKEYVDNISCDFLKQFESENEFFNEILEETCEKIDILKSFLSKIFSNNLNEKFNSICLISGGETTVTLNSHSFDGQKSKGGRNMEMSLAYKYVLNSIMNKEVLDQNCDLLFSSFGSDGIDGPTDAAGAYILLEETCMARNKNDIKEMETFLREHNSYNYFTKYDRLIKTGPTGTNVSDLQILLAKF